MWGAQPGGLLLSSRVSCRRVSARTEMHSEESLRKGAVFRHTFWTPYFKTCISSLSLCGDLEPVLTSAFWSLTVLSYVFRRYVSVVSRNISMQINTECAPHLFSIKSSQKSFAPSENINIFVGSSSEGHLALIVLLPLEHPKFNNCDNCKSGFWYAKAFHSLVTAQ